MRYVLNRTGSTPVEFEGDLMFAVTNRIQGVVAHPRWHTVAVYDTAGDEYVVGIEYHQAGGSHCTVEVVPGAIEARDTLRAHDPGAYFTGDESELAELRRRYAALVEESLFGLDAALVREHVIDEPRDEEPELSGYPTA